MDNNNNYHMPPNDTHYSPLAPSVTNNTVPNAPNPYLGGVMPPNTTTQVPYYNNTPNNNQDYLLPPSSNQPPMMHDPNMGVQPMMIAPHPMMPMGQPMMVMHPNQPNQPMIMVHMPMQPQQQPIMMMQPAPQNQPQPPQQPTQPQQPQPTPIQQDIPPSYHESNPIATPAEQPTNTYVITEDNAKKSKAPVKTTEPDLEKGGQYIGVPQRTYPSVECTIGRWLMWDAVARAWIVFMPSKTAPHGCCEAMAKFCGWFLWALLLPITLILIIFCAIIGLFADIGVTFAWIFSFGFCCKRCKSRCDVVHQTPHHWFQSCCSIFTCSCC